MRSGTGFRRFLTSVRARLLLLVCLSVLPAAGLVLYSSWNLRTHAIRDAVDSTSRIVRLVASEQARLIVEGRELLGELGERPEIRFGRARECEAVLERARLTFPMYGELRFANLGVADASGEVLCSALPLAGPVNITDRRYFSEAVRTRAFAVGDLQIGRITGKPSLNLGHPLLDRSGGAQRVLFAALDLEWIPHVVSRIEITAGTVVTLIDPQGTILARFPEPGGWIGFGAAFLEPLRESLEREPRGIARFRGADDVERLYATAPLDDSTGRLLGYVSAGVPTTVIFAEARRILARDLVLIGIGLLLIMTVAWVGSDAVMLRWTKALRAAAVRFGSGDLDYRIGPFAGPEEFKEVAGALDTMADALQRREAQIHQARRSLEESEQRFRRLAENAPDIIYRYQLRPTPRVDYVSPVVADTLGYTPEEIYADPELGFRLVHPDDIGMLQEALQGSPIPGRTLALRATHRDGSDVWLEVRDAPVYDAEGRLVAVEGIARDITEQKRIERRLRLQVSMLDAVGQALIATDPSGQIIYWNRAAELLYGWPAADVTGRDVAEITVPELSRDQAAEIMTRLQAGEAWTGEFPVRRRDGTVFPALVTNAPAHDAGSLIAIIGISTDLSQIKRTQAEISLQASALESAANAIVITDPQGRITWANAAFTDLTGYPLTEAIGQTPQILKSGLHDAAFYQDLWEAILAGRVWRGEMTNRRKDGTLYTEEQTITPILDQAGNVTHFIAIKEDVTARRESEAEIRRQNLMLRSLREIDIAITGSLDLRVTLTVLLDQISAYLGVDAVCAFLLTPQAQILTLTASRGFREDAANGGIPTSIRVGEGLAGQAALERALRGISAGAAAAEHSPFQAILRRERFEAQHAVPLISKGDVRGVLVALHPGADGAGRGSGWVLRGRCAAGGHRRRERRSVLHPAAVERRVDPGVRHHDHGVVAGARSARPGNRRPHAAGYRQGRASRPASRHERG